MTVGLIGRDSFSIDGVDATQDMAEGDIISITADSDLNNAGMSYGGVMVVAENRNGQLCSMTARFLRGTATDAMLLKSYSSYEKDSPTFVCHKANLSQRLGDGNGSVKVNNYDLTDIVFSRKPVDVTINVDGAVEQSAREYQFRCLVSNSIG